MEGTHYLPPRWMKPYRHAEAHGHWRGMQCKSSWKLPFNDGVGWQFWDCQPIMEFAPKPKPKPRMHVRHIFWNVLVWRRGAVYPRGHRFLISFEELLPVSATPAGCCIDLPQKRELIIRGLSWTRVWRAGVQPPKKGPDRRTCQQQQWLFKGQKGQQNFEADYCQSLHEIVCPQLIREFG